MEMKNPPHPGELIGETLNAGRVFAAIRRTNQPTGSIAFRQYRMSPMQDCHKVEAAWRRLFKPAKESVDCLHEDIRL
jgi:hypothetical protein